MKPIRVLPETYINFTFYYDTKLLKYKIGDYLQISNYEKYFLKSSMPY